jgi:SAM-dependent methyltransferase
MFDIAALKARHFPEHQKASAVYMREVQTLVKPGMIVLDAGCGRTAPMLRRLPQTVRRIGIDVIDGVGLESEGIEYYKRDLADTGLPDGSCDVVISRSVLEHLAAPEPVFEEIARVLKPGGTFLFLTPNGWDYVSVLSRIVPNRFHPYLVAAAEGRDEEDVFPVMYRANSARSLRRLAAKTGMQVGSLTYLGSQPSYLKFNSALYAVGTQYERLLRRFRFLHPLRGWILGTIIKPAPSRQAAGTQGAT